MRFRGFVGDAYTSRSPIADGEQLWNWYVEQVESGQGHAKATPVLYPAPGFTTFVTLPKSPVRGIFAQDDRAWAVAGDSLYELYRDATFVERPLTALVTPAAPTVAPSPPIPPLPVPGVPVIYQGGTTGTTRYGYKVTATNAVGETAASAEGFFDTGPLTLSLADFLIVSWAIVPLATGYKIYRTTGGASPPRLVATIVNGNQSSFMDNGGDSTAATPPTVNTSGSPTPTTPWGYKITATNVTGETIGSTEGTALGYAVLDARHWMTVTWTAVANATGYNVYRTTSPAITPPVPPGSPTVPANTVVKIASVQSDVLTVNDHATVFEPVAVVPIVNTTLASGLVNDNTVVTFASSGDAGQQLFITSGGTGYIFNLETSALTAAVNGATQGAYLDGYFLAFDFATSTLRVSGFLNGLLWDPTQVAQRTIGSDRWVSMAVIARDIWMQGSETAEIWQNLGTSPFPFGPNPSLFVEKGVASTWSPMRANQVLVWLGRDISGSGVVYRSDGYGAARVSTHAVEAALQGYNNLSDAEAFSYQDGGHTFYVLTLPSVDQTWVLDLATGSWAQRGVWDQAANRFHAYRARCHCYAFTRMNRGLHLVGDRSSGVVAVMALDTGVDMGGGVIRRVRRAPHLSNEQLRLTYRRMEVDLEVGLGLAVGQGSDPTMMLRWSDDGGKTWSNEHWTSGGKIGAYRQRVRWARLGTARDRVFEFAVTDAIPWRLIDASITIEGAPS